jgi:raffinose/stachyose/melibiose transport system substrate-binding protein
MMSNRRRRTSAVVIAVSSLALAACGGGGDSADGAVELSFLVDNDPTTVETAEALAAAYQEQNADVTIEVESRPTGGEGDNIVKTRLSTGDMTDIFQYNSGSLFQALAPSQTLVPVTGEDFVERLDESYVESVTADGEVYGVPFQTGMGGGVLYNRAIYEELGLEVPQTWDEFMDNNAAIQEAGKVPVIQTYQDTWTSQLFVLGDFHNVVQEEPDFAEQYTAGEAKFADTEAAQRGFEHLQAVQEAGYVNEDFASATYQEGLQMLATGEGAHYPMLTFAVPEIAAQFPDELGDVGFFALPGEDASSNGLTLWAPSSIYIPQSTPEEEIEAAKDFMAFVASPEGCDVMTEAISPSGPYLVEGCELPDDVPQAVKDLQTYVDEERTTPALEFLSPIKGPALEQITVEVGSGIRSAEDGAALYDEDAEKQAQQLGIEGW